MVIGVCTFELYLAGVQSLKMKRGILARLRTKVVNKFNVSFAEVSQLDSWQRSTVAVAIVSNEQRFCNQVLSKISELVASNGETTLIDQKMFFL